MNMLKWKIGDVEIFQIVEIEDCGKLIQSIIKDATSENVRKIKWLYPHFAGKKGNLKAAVQSFLIKSGKNNILVDPCNGNNKIRTDISEWSNLQTNFIKNLNKIIREKEINIVACTHMHCDHVGWNTMLENSNWVPTFQNAKYLFVKEEYDYWKNKPDKEIADDRAAFNDSVVPIIKEGLAQFVKTDYKIDKNISLIPTPGHTPGHVSILIESKRKRAIISGDILHHPCQIANPEWSTDSSLPDIAKGTRKRMLEEIADTDTLFIGSHFSNPVAGNIIKSKKGFVFKI